jgi:hypothetical protein
VGNEKEVHMAEAKKKAEAEAPETGGTLRIPTYDSPDAVPHRIGKNECFDALNSIVEGISPGTWLAKDDLRSAVAKKLGRNKRGIYVSFQKALERCSLLRQSAENDCAFERV